MMRRARAQLIRIAGGLPLIVAAPGCNMAPQEPSCGETVETERTLILEEVPDVSAPDAGRHVAMLDEDGPDQDDDPIEFARCLALCGDWYAAQHERFDQICAPQLHGNGVPTCEIEPRGESARLVCRFQSGRIAGRRFRGFRMPTFPLSQRGWLASMLELERAAVHAFTELASDLERLHAPQGLVRSAQEAARDEARHAEIFAVLLGETQVLPTKAPSRREHPATLCEVARLNAVEGCVRESFAAFVLSDQAQRAPDPTIRSVFALLAPDEARHGLLATDVDAWLRERLTYQERARVGEARAQAIAELSEQSDEPLDPWLGMPSIERRAQLLAQLV